MTTIEERVNEELSQWFENTYPGLGWGDAITAIAQLITDEKIAELEKIKNTSGMYSPDRAYTKSYFYVVDQEDIEDRINQLKDQRRGE